MSKRFATTCFIVIACVIIACVVFVTGLFLMPGVSLFGLKYIGHNTHDHGNLANTAEAAITTSPVILSVQKDANGNQLGDFSGIIVNCYEVPVHVVLSNRTFRKVNVLYRDNYNGLTTSKIKDPSLSYEKDDAGNIVINISEYHSFLYESGISNRYLEIDLPFQMLTEDIPYEFNLEINSSKSNVTFELEMAESNLTLPAKFNRLAVKTNGDLNFNHFVSAKTFCYETSKTIKVNEDDKIDAKNYELASSNGKIVVNKDVEGDLTCATTLGKVLFKSCRNLTATTTFGDVDFSGEEGAAVVNGIANISTRAGNVKIGQILGNSAETKNKISTSSGNVIINSLLDGEITTQRGAIKINSVREASVVSKTGKVVIQEVKTKLYAQTVRSSITLGGESMLVNDIDIHSTLGNIEVLSSSGSVNIEAYAGNVKYFNMGSTDINIYCGGKLSADRLYGNVNIYAGKDILFANFYDISQGNVEISTGEKCKIANIHINEEYYQKATYYVTATSVNVKQFLNNEWRDINEEGSTTNNYTYINSENPCSFTMKMQNDSFKTSVILYFSTIANFNM